MGQRIFGLETEYAFTALGPRAVRIPPETALGRFMELAKRLPHLSGKDSGGIFLQNGSRFYLDSGNHPEVAIPEVVNPWDACRYILAGERILADLARQLVAAERRIEQVFLTSCNVGYGGRPTTWACHESYGHQADLGELPSQLIPHLVSRVIFTGAGGFNNRSSGMEFMVSPRVAHLERTSSSDSQRNRGIYHDKDESLSFDGFHRLHVLCGESACSHTASWLKVASTALVVAMIEARLLGDRAVQLRNPLAAMGCFGLDVDCKARVRGTNGRPWSALEIQRHYLERAEAHLDHPVMPPWAPVACRRWREMLDRLEGAPQSVAKTLDWAIKLSLYRDYAERRGITWESLPHWNHVLVQLDRALRGNRQEGSLASVCVELLASGSPVADDVARLTPWLRQRGMRWDQLETVLALRQQLYEIDSRFSQLGEQGIFGSLDRAGVLEHRFEGVDNIEHAMANPPEIGRAHLRGECIRRFHRNGSNYRCDWRGVWDFQEGRFLDLSDPFAAEEKWTPLSEQNISYDDPFPRFLQTTLRQAFRYYDQGRFEESQSLLERIGCVQELLDRRAQVDYLRLRAWVATRRGFLEGEALLDSLPQARRESLWGILDYASVHRFRGLIPSPQTSHWIEKGRELLGEQADRYPEARTAFREHQGYLLMSEGRLEQARDVLLDVCRLPRRTGRMMRVVCRARATLGEVHRRLGNPNEARQLLEEVRLRQAENHYEGDLAAFTLTCLAKLETEPARARSILEDARRIQIDLQDRVGEARTLLLEARLSDDAGQIAQVKRRLLELRQQLPALAQCRLFGSVLERWDPWAGGDLCPDETGDVFWGL